MAIQLENHEKRKERKKISAEDFTPSFLVKQMADKLKEYSPEAFKDRTFSFLDPACGNGQILIEILKRKLQYKSKDTTPLQCLNQIWGCDIFQDNIKECRLRLLAVLYRWYNYKGVVFRAKTKLEAIRILYRNIVCTPLCKYPKGSLDYLSLPASKTFNTPMKKRNAEKMYKAISNGKLLKSVSIN